MRYFLHFAISVACAEVLTQISFDKHLKEKNSWTVSTDCCKSCKFMTCEIALEICTSCRKIGKWNELSGSSSMLCCILNQKTPCGESTTSLYWKKYTKIQRERERNSYQKLNKDSDNTR
uniref:Bm10897 n=1 Tax=Brugia malayi TaxID=6279 RepID=A0A0H5SQB8_BRUMA|nr:Bm10897 [Brugia malayi]